MKSLFNGECANPIYRREPGLSAVAYNGKRIIINPSLGGWAVVSDAEYVQLMSPTGTLPPALGEEAYRRGLARKNGHSVYDASAQAEGLFFFEIHISDKCNLACPYCSSSTSAISKVPQVDPVVGFRWVDRVVEYCSKNMINHIFLEFTGGEPLANIHFLDSTVDYAFRQAEANDICVEAIIVSNLTILGKRQIEFLKKYPVRLNISLDGEEIDHDKQRPFASGKGTYRTVMRNINRLKENGIQPKSVQTTVTSRTVDRMPAIAQFLLDLGYLHLTLQYMSEGGAPAGSSFLKPDPDAYVANLFEVFETQFIPFWRRTGVMPYARHLSVAYAYLLEPKRTYMCQRSPCGAGRTIIAVKGNGDVFGCATGPWHKSLCYGNIFNHSFEECQKSCNAIASSSRHFSRIPECSSCLYRGFCQAGCPKDAFCHNGSIMTPGGNCEFYKALWKRSLETLVDERYPDDVVRAQAQYYLR